MTRSGTLKRIRNLYSYRRTGHCHCQLDREWPLVYGIRKHKVQEPGSFLMPLITREEEDDNYPGCEAGLTDDTRIATQGLAGSRKDRSC
jgi:hypothetical protein